MPGLTIEREIEIFRRRLEELNLVIRNNRIYLEEVRRLQERLELLNSRVQNLRNRINNSN